MVYFVGAGSGAPDLITVRAQRLIREADVIIYAGSLVNPQLLEEKKADCAVYNSAKMTLEEVLAVMQKAECDGKMTVRLHTGDPCIYGAVREQMDALDEMGISYESCPGVSSFCGAAAALNLEYTLPDVSQSVILTRMAGRTAVPERESVASFAAHHATMVIFLSTGLLKELSEELIAGGYAADTPAAIVYKATWPEEEKYLCTVGTLVQTAEEHGITKTALIIVGDVVTHTNYRRSELYNPAFATGYRDAKDNHEFHIISFTRTGFLLSRRMRDALMTVAGLSDEEIACSGAKNDSDTKENPSGRNVHLYTKKGRVAEEFSEAELVEEPVKDWCAKVFPGAAALIFIGAAGIAVRTIAPFLVSKASDPAVLVADEQGRHIVSLLSGHLGGGNELTERLAAQLGAEPVITTASDVNGRLAVDVWARKNDCVIANLPAAKCVAAEIAAGKRIPIFVEIPMAGELPEVFVLSQNNSEGRISDQMSVVVSVFRDYRVKCGETLHLIPRTVVLGIGCKKGKSFAEIRDVLTRILEEQNLCVESIGAVASIDLKHDESGLVALARELNAPFQTFSAEILQNVPGEYAPSAFVEKTTGVDNVCERAAMAALPSEEQKGARFLCRKQAMDGVTAALLLKTWRVDG